MDYKINTLKNGLPVITVNVPSLASATVSLWVFAGSRDEDPKISGISHFLEHMGFKGGRKYKTAFDVSETIDAIGGEFNAATNKEYTMYYVRSAADSVETSLDVLSDMLLYPSLKPTDIKREKGVVIEELNMYEDTPRIKVFEVFENVVYENHSLSMDIGGTKKSVSSLTRKNLVDYREKLYVSENMVACVVGGVSHTKALELVRKYFQDTPKGSKSKKHSFQETQSTPKVKHVKKKIEQAHSVIGFPALNTDSKYRYALKILSALLGGGMSSRLFTEVREKRGLCYSVYTSLDDNVDTGYFSVYTGTDPQKAKLAIDVIRGEMYGLAKGLKSKKITTKELTKAKDYLKGHFALAFEDSRYITRFFADEYLRLAKIRMPEDFIKGVENVKLSDVYDLAAVIFKPEKENLVSISPLVK